MADLSAVVSAVAHRLRTPLTVISSTVNNFLDGVYGRLNSDQIIWMKKMESHLVRLEEFLDQVLEIVRQSPDKAQAIQGVLHESPVVRTELPAIEPSNSTCDGSTPLILVADDEVDVQDVIRQGLEMEGLRVKTASTAHDAIASAKLFHPDVILMDLFLGDKNGLEVGHMIKTQISKNIPIVIITGQDDLRDKMAEFNDNADDLLAKPFQMTELRIRVASMLRLKSYMERANK